MLYREKNNNRGEQMKSKYEKWLTHEIKIWQENGLVDDDIAIKINNYYTEKEKNEPNKLGAILGVAGFILIGLGIILILAKNWDFMPRGAKVLVSFLPFLIGSFAGMIILKKCISGWILEAIAVFTTIGILTAIVMSGQIYHIIADEWLLFLIVALLSLPLIYLYDSTLTLGAYLILGSLCMFMNNFNTLWMNLALGIILIGLSIPYAVKCYKKDKLSTNTGWSNTFLALAGFVFMIAIPSMGLFQQESYILYFILLIGIDTLLYEDDISLGKRAFAVLGSIGFYMTLFIFTFEEFWYFMYAGDINWQYETLIVFLLGAAAAILAWLIKTKRDFAKKYTIHFLTAAVIIAYRWIGISDPVLVISVTIMLNIFFITLAIMMIREGIICSSMGRMNVGLLLLTALIIARFFDSEVSFLIKGLAFIGCGIVFLLANRFLMNKRKKEVAHV